MKTIFTFVVLLLLSSHVLLSQGKVYLVLGSDTAIWEGMDVARYNCTYALSLYTDPTRNAALVMDPAFRLPLRDSYGTPVKLTWWMMAGNIFRFATNTNVPNPNTMTLHLMKKYHGASIDTWGDELTLHYHTFAWTDYNGDGLYYWNQALSFAETSDDFDVTLAEMLLEEETFPASFRSGWHWMDNAWQQRLDTLLPYSMHNDWPSQRTDLTEPLDNTFDWSRAPSTFVPFHPSPTDYQVPGSGRGWNVRSEYMSSADSTFMWTIFARAAAGIDQVVCLWAHLPEADFLDNVRKINSSAHKVAPLYPGVDFRYCTAVESMQLWRETADTVKPQLQFTEIPEGSNVRWAITSNEPLFQTTPFVAAKNRYGEYFVLPCNATARLTWETSVDLPRTELAKVGVAATDNAGNVTTAILRYLPEDIFIDDTDPGYTELSGSWGTSTASSWGTTSRVSTLAASDSAKAEWTAPNIVGGMYNIFAQVPQLSNPAQQIEFRLMEGGQAVGTKSFSEGVPPNRWVHLGTRLIPSTTFSVQMIANGSTQPGKQAAADVINISALVRDKWLVIDGAFDVGEVIVLEETIRSFPIRNEGILPVVVSTVTSLYGTATVRTVLPLTIPAMGEAELQFNVMAPNVGPLVDTVEIVSDDPRHSLVRTPMRGNVVHYFAIVDDRDSMSYSETGTWHFSVASAHGPTSRYAYPASGVSAAFVANLTRSGVYQINEIVPRTVNASVRARYVLRLNGARVDTAFLDQNAASGGWVQIMEHFVQAGTEVRLELTDAMSPPVPAAVLRADAIRFQWIRDSTTDIKDGQNNAPSSFSLSQNYPNPFNPTTTFRIRIAKSGLVSLKVYDLLGQEVGSVLNEHKEPGTYDLRYDASRLASGVYLYRLSAGTFTQTRKMILAR